MIFVTVVRRWGLRGSAHPRGRRRARSGVGRLRARASTEAARHSPVKNDDRVFLTPDEVEEGIRSIASDLRRIYAGIADVRIDSEEHQYYSMSPTNPKACGFSFILDQWLDIELAGGRWELDWTEDGIPRFWRMVESIAAERIVAY
jgi:hypothetical protein